MTYDSLIFLLTLTACTAYAVLVWVFFRIPGNRVMRALTWYFIAMFTIYSSALFVEYGLDVELGNRLWSEWRALFFRGAQAVASVWLLVAVTRNR